MKPNLGVLLVSTILVIGSVPVTYAAEPKVLKIAWTSGASWSAMPYRIAAERGYWDREGLKARFYHVSRNEFDAHGPLAGEVDYITILPFIAGAACAGCRLRSWRPQRSRADMPLSQSRRSTASKLSRASG